MLQGTDLLSNPAAYPKLRPFFDCPSGPLPRRFADVIIATITPTRLSAPSLE